MKIKSLQPSSKLIRRRFVIFALLAATFILSGTWVTILGQSPQLSLADIIVALRSKKASLPEKNKILADAVQSRGTTFALTPEIEKELEGTGAEKSLIDSIRQRSQIAKTSAAIPPPVEVKPKVEAAPVDAASDFSFYEKRADASLAKGDLDAAMIDYTKAIEMNGLDIAALMGRASTYAGRNSFTLAIADYTKVIELAPKNTTAYTRRAEAQEKKEKLDLALADYKKVLELDPANDSAKASVARLEPEKPKEKPEAVAPTPVAAPPVAVQPVLPEFVVLGQLSESMAVRTAKPAYPVTALHMNIGGKVVVEVEMDIEGNVTTAKTVSGNPYFKQSCEDASKKWKFKPAMVGKQAVKAKGFLTFNFVPTR